MENNSEDDVYKFTPSQSQGQRPHKKKQKEVTQMKEMIKKRSDNEK